MMSTLTIALKAGNVIQIDDFQECCNNHDNHNTYKNLKYLSLKSSSAYTFIGKTTVTIKGEDILYLLMD